MSNKNYGSLPKDTHSYILDCNYVVQYDTRFKYGGYDVYNRCLTMAVQKTNMSVKNQVSIRFDIQTSNI